MIDGPAADDGRGDGFGSVDQAGPGPHHHSIGVDGPHGGLSGYPIEDQTSLRRCPVEVVATGGDDHVIGSGGCDVVPRDGYGLRAGSHQNRFTAGCGHHIGNPMTAEERRVDPFKNEDARSWSIAESGAHVGGEAIQAVTQRRDDGGAAFGYACGIGDRDDRVDDLVESLWIDLEHQCATTESFDGLVDVATRHGADATQVLAEDEVGIASSKRIFIEVIELVALRQAFTNLGVDLGGRQMLGVEPTDHDLAIDTSLWWKVALERDTEK